MLASRFSLRRLQSQLLRFDPAREADYLAVKFDENISLSMAVASAAAVLSVLLWLWDWAIDSAGAPQTFLLRLLLGIVVAVQPACALAGLSRRSLAIVLGVSALLAEAVWGAILNRLVDGALYGIGGYMFFLLLPPIITVAYPFHINAPIIALLAVLPIAGTYVGLPEGLDQLRYAALIFPACGIAVFNCFIFDWFQRRSYLKGLELKRLAGADDLTGIANRRNLLQQGERLVGIARRSRQPVSVLSLDLDRFKLLNDTFGHAAGDAALRHAVGIVEATLRETDALGRMGGEEFVALLPDTNARGAATLAERIRAALEATPMPWPRAQGGSIAMTVSIGIASIVAAGPEDTLETLLRRADEALYRSKQSGRNHASLWSAEDFPAQILSSAPAS